MGHIFMNMKHDHIIGTKDWQNYVIKFLSNHKEQFMRDGKDLKAYNMEVLIDDLKEYFQSKRK